ncbi:hypothetical protein KC669_01625 [Candidatus Dojkabacteria bacterium]|uniref:Uncharacterized protein n=1 Tax=Candidatus Dojkabacteria bacterium TaxID=2099670 RepID=A0A955RLV5_9BACT|nr:hypothetical protein [Candidatus Dojkabacteria bacterium]
MDIQSKYVDISEAALDINFGDTNSISVGALQVTLSNRTSIDAITNSCNRYYPINAFIVNCITSLKGEMGRNIISEPVFFCFDKESRLIVEYNSSKARDESADNPYIGVGITRSATEGLLVMFNAQSIIYRYLAETQVYDIPFTNQSRIVCSHLDAAEDDVHYYKCFMNIPDYCNVEAIFSVTSYGGRFIIDEYQSNYELTSDIKRFFSQLVLCTDTAYINQILLDIHKNSR